MEQNVIPIVQLQEPDVTLAELIARFREQAVALQLPRSKSVLLLLPPEDYRFVTSPIQNAGRILC